MKTQEQLLTSELNKEQEKILKSEDIKVCKLTDASYPKALQEIAKPPEVLYCRGALLKERDFALAIVGTRKNTPYAERVLERIIPELVGAGAIIVSGLALGVDTLAHKITLACGGRTVAVLGGGVDKKTIYPHTNYSLAEEIIKKGGALISEYSPLCPPAQYTFPARNRIIAGLTRGVLVVEAPEKSGALITAYSALDEGRDVFAIPADITRAESRGSNALIRRGAKPVTCAGDILEEYGIAPEEKQKIEVKLDKSENTVVSLLDNEPKHIDELTRALGLPVSTLSGILAILEIKGVVKNIGGMRFVKL